MENQIKQKLNRELNNTQEKLPIKIVQFGGGNFMRGFTDYVIDKLNKETDWKGGIVNLQATPNGSIQKMEEQDNYTPFSREELKKEKLLMKSTSFLPFKNQLIHILSMKIFSFGERRRTGICIFQYYGNRNCLRRNGNFLPRSAQKFPAKVAVLLYERFKHFNGAADKGLRIIPCELIEDNAFVLRDIIIKYAQLWNLEDAFVEWIHQNNYFHNTLVDRIVPGYPKDDAESYEDQLDYEDQMMVVSETFLLFVIQEAGNLNERIPFNKINEQILVVDDIQPYRLRKVRILNGGHTLMLAPANFIGKRNG